MLTVAVGAWKALWSPAGRVVAVAALALIFVSSVYVAGYRAAMKESRVEAVKAERDAAIRDLRAAKDAARLAEQMADISEFEAEQARRRADEYAKELPSGTNADLTDADIKRLRDIRNRKKR